MINPTLAMQIVTAIENLPGGVMILKHGSNKYIMADPTRYAEGKELEEVLENFKNEKEQAK